MKIEFRHLDAVEVVGRVFYIWWNAKELFAQLALTVLLPLVVLGSMVLEWTMMGGRSIMSEFMDIASADYSIDSQKGIEEMMEQVVAKKLPQTLLALVVYIFAILIMSLLGRAAMMHAVLELYKGRTTIHLIECCRQGLHRIPTMFMADLVLILTDVVLVVATMTAFLAPDLFIFLLRRLWIVGMLLVLCTPIIVFYQIAYVFHVILHPAIVVERLASKQAIQRAWSLSRSGACEVLLSGVLVSIAIGLGRTLLGVLVQRDSKIGFWVYAAYSVFVGFPCASIYQSVVYFNRRIDQEGLTKAALLRVLSSSDDHAPAPVSCRALNNDNVV